MNTIAKSLIALSLVLSLCSVQRVQAQQPVASPTADAIYTGGPIITMNDAAPQAEAVAVKDGKIIAVGTKAEVEKFKAAGTKAIDLAGKTLLPGFIDGHGHCFGTGFQAVSANLLPPPDGGVDSIAKLQEVLRAYASTDIAKRFNIIIGFGYDDSQLAELRHPTRQELDAVSADIPIMVTHQSGHLASMNSKALELAGITGESVNPQGGVIRREADGKTPNGVLEETAYMLSAGRVLPKLGPEQLAQLALAGQELYIRHGYTTAQEGGAVGPMHSSFVKLAEAGQMKIDVVSYVNMMSSDEPTELSSLWYSRTYKNGYRVGGVKIMLDGSPQGKTAHLTQPYFKPPSGLPASYRGYETLSDAAICAKVQQAFAKGWQILAHCNGDAAIDQYIGAVREAAAKDGPADRRSVAIHAQTARLDQLDSMKELGIMPSFFGMHCFYWGDWHRDETLGPARAERISPAQSALRRGMIFTQHHDSPVAQPSAIRILSSVVTRRTRSGDILGADERIGVNDALKSLTIWGAYQHFEEKSKGSLETGKVADFVVLSGDPFAVDIEDLDELTVVETIKGGKSIYKADAKATKVGANTLPELPPMQWDNAAERPPVRGIYAYAPLPGPCGCAGCALGHIITMGRREVATTSR
jgi:predicted amidohydrolase YtcJ